MKILLTLFVLLFSSSLVAEDISNFQIEGMTVGDSLLDFYEEKEIKEAIKNTVYYYPDKKFLDIFIKTPSSSNYDWFQITLKSNDKNYKVYIMTGLIDYINNIKDCYPKKTEIAKEIKNIFDHKIKLENSKQIHSADKSGKSTIDRSTFQIKGGEIQVECTDWSKNVEWTDNLRINIKSDEAIKYLWTAFE